MRLPGFLRDVRRRWRTDVATEALDRTYCGAGIPPLKRGLPKGTVSACPVCLQTVLARLFDEDGRVLMEKRCPDHGSFRDLYWSDVVLYLKAEAYGAYQGRGLANPTVQAAGPCPTQCGLCRAHLSQTLCGNVDLTNRCNLGCPTCFAGAGRRGPIYEPRLETIVEMLRAYRAQRPVPVAMLQFAGGEPTLHPQFVEAVRAATALGFPHIQVATNGLAFADLEFAERCKEAGLHTAYLQFDGVEEAAYLRLRGRPLLEKKLRAFENLKRVGIVTVFVPTLVRGINDDQVGGILRLAVANADFVAGVSFQPIAFTGRVSEEDRAARRFTLPDLAWAVEQQTGYARARSDWYPLSCLAPLSRLLGALGAESPLPFTCHPHCALATYIVVDERQGVTPFTRFLDVDGLLPAMERLAEAASSDGPFRSLAGARALWSLRRHFRAEAAPAGLSFESFLALIDGLRDKSVGRNRADPIQCRYRALMLAGMHFMDNYNYDLERIRRCVVHYITPGGRIYPFCSYNAGPTYRRKVEEEFGIPLERWKEACRQ